jgi:hypothetical protein
VAGLREARRGHSPPPPPPTRPAGLGRCNQANGSLEPVQ